MRVIFFFVMVIGVFGHSGNFVQLGETIVPETKARHVPWSGKFVHPNELSPGQFDSDDLQALEGLLVSVGTIRTLLIFCWAPHITHLLMTDIDGKVVEFNRAHLRFIADLAQRYPADVAAQRMVYMANLLGYEPTEKEVTDWAFENRSFENLRVLITSDDKELHNYKDSNIFMREIFSHKWAEEHRRLSNLYGYKRVANEQFYWENNEQWQKIVDALQNNLIAVTNLSVIDDLPEIASCIRSLEVELGAMDVSNIAGKRYGGLASWGETLRTIGPKKVISTEMLGWGNLFSYSCHSLEHFLCYLQFGLRTGH